MKINNLIKQGSLLLILTLFFGNVIAQGNMPIVLAAKAAKTEAKETISTDNQLADKVRDKFVKEKLFAKDKFAEMEIHVTADKGVITLTGRVDSKIDENRAVKLANSVDGVKRVDSKLKIKIAKKEPLTDNQLADNVRDKFVKEKLFGKDKFADMGIHITADKGVITITGKVDGKSDENRAVKIANSVDGVKSVKSKLSVKSEEKKSKK